MSEEKKKKFGKFYIQTTINIYFETNEEREHYIKDHIELPFDDRLDLLNNKPVEFSDDEEMIMSTVEVKEVKD